MRECQLYLPFAVLMHCRQPHKLFHYWTFFYQEYTLQLANYFSVEKLLAW
jgi:hypothetical protein